MEEEGGSGNVSADLTQILIHLPWLKRVLSWKYFFTFCSYRDVIQLYKRRIIKGCKGEVWGGWKGQRRVGESWKEREGEGMGMKDGCGEVMPGIYWDLTNSNWDLSIILQSC